MKIFRIFLAAFTFVVLVVVIILESGNQEQELKNKLREYPDIKSYEKINGVIKSFELNRGGIYFQFEDGASYSMGSSRNYLYSPPSLGDFLRIGDSLIKKEQDSLIIFRSNNKYYFIIGEFINP